MRLSAIRQHRQIRRYRRRRGKSSVTPHEVYIETHLGGGAILERKRPVARSVGVDLDPEVGGAWAGRNWPGLELHCCDAVDFLAQDPCTGREFVYTDPPYVASSSPFYYRHEYDDDALTALPCAVMVSGCASELYGASPLSA